MVLKFTGHVEKGKGREAYFSQLGVYCTYLPYYNVMGLNSFTSSIDTVTSD